MSSRPQLFPRRGQKAGLQLGSTPTKGPGADCVALPGLPPGLQHWVCSGRKRERGRSLGRFLPLPHLWHCLSYRCSYFSTNCYFFQTILVESMYHPKAGGPRCGRLWLEMVQFYCTGAKTTTTKEENGKKKRQKKGKKKKKSQFEDGTICSLETPDPCRSIGGYFLCIVFVLCSQGEVLGPLL